MAATNTKNFLLFQPAMLFSKKPVVSIRQLIKTPQGVTTGEQPLTRNNFKTLFKKLNDEDIKALLPFSVQELQKKNAAIHHQASYIANNDDRNEAIKKNYHRYVYSLIGSLRRLHTAEWYHPVDIDNQRVQNMQCSFYSYPVEVSFVVHKNEHKYHIETFVETGKTNCPLLNFKRYFFLLEKDNCYYQISPQAYDAVEYVTGAELPCESLEQFDAFLQKLGSWGFKIDRTEIEEETSVTVIPECQILLSELSNTFLKLEPQFVYDGIKIDGAYQPVSKVEIAGKTISINRNKEKEFELVDFLQSLHEKFSTQHNGFFYLTFSEAQKKGWFLKTYHLLLDREISLLGIDLLKHFRYAPFKAETTLRKLEPQGDFDCIEFTLKFGKEIVPLSLLQKTLLNNQRAVMLKDGSLGILGDDWLQQYGIIVKHGKVAKTTLLVAKWLMLGEVTSEFCDENTVVRTGITTSWFLKWQQWKKQETQLYNLPAKLQVDALRPYQHAGYDWLRLLAEIGASGCLADDMGLGKTLQTISFLSSQLEVNELSKHLVIAPASLLYNWQKELEKFAPDIKTAVLHGSKRDTALVSDHTHQVIITSYGTMRQDIKLLESIVWDTIVLDESHNIKNPSAQTTKAVWQLIAKTKIALSGTPIMNSTSDLHSQMHFLMPGLLGTPEFFKKEYTVPIEQQANEQKAAALQKLIHPFILRRTKEQVANDLPERTESILWCEMDSDQRAAYETIKENVRSNIFTEIETNGLNKGKLSVLAGLTKLRQICNSAELVKDEDLFTYDSIKTSILINELNCIIPQHRALIFSQFTSMLDLLERDLGKAGIPVLRLDGQTSIHKRQELVDTFQSDNNTVPVFLISLKAGNTGLTLTKADYVFLFDPWWNTAVESQAIDRTHRIGQLQKVFAYRMVCRNSIEEKIIKLAGNKKKLAEDLITTDESLMKGLSIEDIQYLFE